MTAFRFSLLTLALVALAACQSPADAPAPAAADTPVAPTALTSEAPTPDPDAPLVTVYKSPTCGCCSMWVEHLEASGFEVESIARTDMGAVKDSLGVPSHLSSCHTGVVDGYVVEGHVPAEQIKRLLDERPDALGLSVPGMPIGSPGMEVGDQRDPYDVVLIGTDSYPAGVYEHIPGDAAP